MIITDDKPVCVIGDVILDVHVRGNVTRISQEAPVPILDYVDEETTLGGAANVASNIGTMGGKARLLCLAGNDQSAGVLEFLLRGKHGKHHIRHMVLKHEQRTTTRKTRYTDTEGRQLLRVDRDMKAVGTEYEEIWKGLQRDDMLHGAGCLVLSDYGKGVLERSVVEYLIREATQLKIPVLVDTKNHWLGMFAGATLVKPNLDTALAMWRSVTNNAPVHNWPDEKAIETVGRSLAVALKGWIAITRGAEGISLFHPREEPLHIHGHRAEVYDVTGAGDAVLACLAAGIASGMTIPYASKMANVAGSLAVRKPGAVQVLQHELTEEWLLAAGPAEKIQDRVTAAYMAQCWREAGKRVVFTNGCFDMLHYGHMHFLKEAKAQGDKLIVGLNSDQSVRSLKGEERPLIKSTERASALAQLDYVDLIVVFVEDHPEELVRAVQPDVMVKGSDYRGRPVAGADFVARRGGRLHLVDLLPGISTSRLVKQEIATQS